MSEPSSADETSMSDPQPIPVPNSRPQSNSARGAIVTGAGRGIGRGIALALAGLGYRLIINYRSDQRSAEQAAADAMAAGSPAAVPVRTDVSRLEEHEVLVHEALERFGRIDLLVNNAGVAPEVRRDLLETTSESWDRALTNNLRGPFFLTQRVAQAMVDLKSRGIVEAPQIHFITSVSSVMASVSRGEYCVAKAGLSMTARLFAVRLADAGIRVYEVRPGIIATDMTSGVRELYDRRIADGLSPIRRWGTPEDVGRAVAALAQDALPFSTGAIIDVDGGLMLPRL